MSNCVEGESLSSQRCWDSLLGFSKSTSSSLLCCLCQSMSRTPATQCQHLPHSVNQPCYTFLALAIHWHYPAICEWKYFNFHDSLTVVIELGKSFW